MQNPLKVTLKSMAFSFLLIESLLITAVGGALTVGSALAIWNASTSDGSEVVEQRENPLNSPRSLLGGLLGTGLGFIAVAKARKGIGSELKNISTRSH